METQLHDALLPKVYHIKATHNNINKNIQKYI